MLCICGKKQATIHLTEIIEGKVQELHLCDACAKDSGVDFKSFLSGEGFLPGPDFLNLLSQSTQKKKETLKRSCPECGLSLKEFEEVGRVGCSSCYESFMDVLLPLIKRMHRKVQHVGASPRGRVKNTQKPKKTTQLEKLRMKLEQSIETEAYESAAKLRDQIQKLEKVSEPQKREPKKKKGSK